MDVCEWARQGENVINILDEDNNDGNGNQTRNTYGGVSSSGLSLVLLFNQTI